MDTNKNIVIGEWFCADFWDIRNGGRITLEII